MKKGAELSAVDSEGRTILHWAVISGEVVFALLVDPSLAQLHCSWYVFLLNQLLLQHCLATKGFSYKGDSTYSCTRLNSSTWYMQMLLHL